jgi:hypothetical protein
MVRGELSFAKICLSSRLVLGALVMCVAAAFPSLALPQADSDIPPDATPQIQQIDPSQAAPGAHVKVVIQGSGFSAGAYVSSVSPAVHVESSKRVSATQLEAQLSVSASAQPSTVSLLVSNPASRAAEAAFKIVAAQPAAPATPAAEVKPSAPATPAVHVAPPAQDKPHGPTTPGVHVAPPTEVKPSAPATPAVRVAPPAQVKPSAPATPAVHVAPPAEVKPSAPATPAVHAAPARPPGPEVTTIEPPRVGPGYDMDLKITGKNFVQGAKVSFANPGVRVMGITSPSSTELTVHVKVARDAAPGVASLYVINPDDREVEAPFEVTGKGATPPSPTTSPTPASTDTQRFDAFHLGNPAEILQVHGKVKGSLVVSAGTIKYQQEGKTLVNISMSEIKEIKVSSIPTNTFHITLTSGKTFLFAPGSLRPADARNIVDSLRKVLLH